MSLDSVFNEPPRNWGEWSNRDDAIWARSAFDGARTLGDAAERLEEYAAYLRFLDEEGFLLRGPVVDDYGLIYHPDGRDTSFFMEG